MKIIFFAIIYGCFFGISTSEDSNEILNDTRPYEFAFNVIDFQHRFEKKDEDGIVTGEYGFITADGIYHETGYATDKEGDFIITKMKNRKLTSKKDIDEFFKEKPEVAKKVMSAIERSCSDCNNLTNKPKIETESTHLNKTIEKDKINSALNGTKNNFKNLEKSPTLPNFNEIQNVRKGKSFNKVDSSDSNVISEKKYEIKDSKILNENLTISNTSEKAEQNLHYHFNYSIPSHGHNEDGYQNGEKDGSYYSKSETGVDVKVEYLSNEFGHQPNISFVPGPALDPEKESLKGYSFLWYRK
ncbi:uncharacterized protein LOC127288930 [Leptopilina boulardi]|uniref:uncharacterized protein LOC127288930 n=1 Tax=Leptopilina boulardi TaxID=63433 RepID=UPI0021F5091B|nr:uncharacterized protein LOC127288930 [Leptopilina boulardi]